MDTREYRTILRRELTDFAAALLTEHPAFGWRLLRREAGTWQSVRSLCAGIVPVPAHLTAVVAEPNEAAEVPARAEPTEGAMPVARAAARADVRADAPDGSAGEAEHATRGGGEAAAAHDLWHVMWTPWPGCTHRCRHRAVVFFHEGLVWSWGAYFDAHESQIPLTLG